MEELKLLLRNLANLVKVKTIITVIVITALTVAFLNGSVQVEVYAPFAATIITYYFTKNETK